MALLFYDFATSLCRIKVNLYFTCIHFLAYETLVIQFVYTRNFYNLVQNSLSLNELFKYAQRWKNFILRKTAHFYFLSRVNKN